MRAWLLAFVVIVLVQGSNCDIKLVNNGYENVNVFIKDTVGEDSSLIPRIEEVFTNVSALMFKATKNRAYIRNVTIVIPKKWKETVPDSQQPSVSAFGEHIRVDRRNRFRGDAPYVRGHLECGKPGWFMHLTPGFLNTVGETDYGLHANAIVHEWGHLRWGLFDEYASIPYPGTSNPNERIQFYNENGQWRPVTCSGEITGGAYRRNCDVSRPCNLNSITVPSQCKFCPDLKQTAKTSFMSSQWIQSLEGFCDEDSNSTEPASRHNSKVPNAQNYYCNGQSAWEVMRNHEDFKDGNNQATSSETDTIPTFQIVQETGKVRVFVYDVSGSMRGDKIIQQKLASYVVIDNVIETGSWLGLVQFSSSASTLAPLTEIKNKGIRSQLKTHVPTSAGGFTDIYSGLAKAIQVIESSVFSTHGTEIILLSDGVSDPYSHIIPGLQSKGIVVHTISITQNADAGMAQLAEDTGGKSYTYLETESVSFVDVLSQAISDGTSDSDAVEKLLGSSVNISAASPFNASFNIDSGLGNSTTITVIRRSGSTTIPIILNITGPDGTNYTNTSTTDIMSVQLDDNAPIGKYETIISTTSNTQIQVEVTITTLPVSDDVEVVHVTSFFSNPTLDFSTGEEQRLYASVEKAGSPVLNATVTAVLAGDSSFTTIELVMKDHGTGADLTANDGVYSVYILKSYFTSNRRYNVKVSVSGDDGTFTYTSDVTGVDSATSLPGAVEDVDYTPVSLDEFQRQSIPGEITVVNYSTGDTTPPARITDFRVESITGSNDTANQTITYTFVWTAVGEDMDVGTASQYDMRMHTDNRFIRDNFDSSPSVPVTLAQPKPTGETERYAVTFTLADCNGTCYLAVRANDTSGLDGEISNLVNVDINFSYEPEQVYPDDDEDDDVVTDMTTTTGESLSTTSTPISTTPEREVIVDTKANPEDGLSDEAVFGIAGGATLFVVIVVVGSLVLINRRKRQTYKKHDHERQMHRDNIQMRIEEPAPQFDNPCYTR